MALSPQSIHAQEFPAARRGYDQAEVDRFRNEVADALEAAQNEATAMEARARAAVARLQELSKAHGQPGEAAGGAPRADVHPSVDESETISRTLLLAQRTADTTIADAQVEADRLLSQRRDDVERLLEEARDDARRAGESERVRVEGEVQALLARRDFLESDVDHLEQFVAAQRERIIEAVAELTALVERVPNGLADMRRPLLSAAADEPVAPGEEAADAEIAEITRVAAGPGADDGGAEDAAAPDDVDAGADEIDDELSDDDVADDVPAGGVDETGDVWSTRDAPRDSTPQHADALFEPDDRA